MKFNPIARMKEELSGSVWQVAVEICGCYVTALIIGTLALGQALTGALLINTALALALLVIVVRAW